MSNRWVKVTLANQLKNPIYQQAIQILQDESDNGLDSNQERDIHGNKLIIYTGYVNNDDYLADTRDFCEEHEIPYDMWFESSKGEEAELFIYRPNMEKPFRTYYTSGEGYPYIPHYVVETFLDKLIDGELSREDAIHEVTEMLKKYTPFDVPSLYSAVR